MAAQVRTVDFLPEIFQTPVNRQFLEATLDQLVQEPKYKQTQGFIGQKVGPGVNPSDGYVVEPTKVRNDYQLDPGVVSLNPTTGALDDVITYPGMLDALRVQGGIVDKADRLFESEYYTWDPFVDFDKYINYSQYYWLPEGPEAVIVSATDIPTEETFTVTRANGAYTFSGYAGPNPAITLVRNGSYNFSIAQNNANAIDYRVTNNGTSSWAIDYEPNPTLTLVRGNTYSWNLTQTGPYKFYIKTQPSYGTTNLYNTGVVNQGAYQGLVIFTVPQDAPDTLYYCNDLEFNLRGQMNIIDAEPGEGPKFWIQTQPGVNGRLPWSPNISSRDVLGVDNNGIDLGTVTFNVPDASAQNFYYSMPYINYPTVGVGRVDLIVPSTLKFNQINGIAVDQFFAAYPTGIDGVTNLDNRTLVFTTQSSDVDSGGWYRESPFDPLTRTVFPERVSTNVSYDVTGQPYDLYPYNTITDVITGPVDPLDGQLGSFDSLPFDQAIPISDQSDQFSVWQIQYVPDTNGTLFIQLNNILPVDNLTQFSIAYGTEYVNTQWYKNAQGYFQQMPLLTAALPYLFYQDGEDPNIFGQIKLINEDLNATIDIITDILGQTNYTSPNGVTFTNGLKVTFEGNITPAEYDGNTYYVYGVGTGIVLCPVNNFIVPETYAAEYSTLPVSGASGTGATVTITFPAQTAAPYILGQTISITDIVSNVGSYNGIFTVTAVSTTSVSFASQTSSDYISGGTITALGNAPLLPEYMTISMASPDLNPWTRANRWFHVDVIAAAAAYNETTPTTVGVQRANRPILEFQSGTRLYNYGTDGIPPVNVIDFESTNALANINGQIGYGIDGYQLQQGSLVIFAGDVDPLVRNQVYEVNFIVPDPNEPGYPVIDLVHLTTTDYSPIHQDQTTVCLDGDTLAGQSFYFNGTNWSPPANPWINVTNSVQPPGTTPIGKTYAADIAAEGLLSAQQKTKNNQPPLFNVYDANGISFGNQTYYPSTNFTGCKLYSYAENPNNTVDPVLGIPLAFFSLNNIGDILFDNNLYTDTFVYTPTGTGITVDVSTGFVRRYTDRITYTKEIGWQTAAVPSLPRQQFQFTYDGNPLQLDILVSTALDITPAQVFVNSIYQLPSTYTLSINSQTNVTIITLNGPGIIVGDIVEVLVYSDQTSAKAFYQIPINLQNNPFNDNSPQFTLGTARSHYNTICENLVDLQGVINGPNNTRDLGNIGVYGQQILQQSSPLTLAGYFLRQPNYDIFAAIEYNSREYIKFKNKLLTTVTQLNIEVNQSISSILDQALSAMNKSLTNANPFYWSDMLPCGFDYTSNTTVVNPITISTFNTVQLYDFTTSNYQGLLVYVNGELLLRGTEYVVSTDAPKLTILIPLSVGDSVTINEYIPTIQPTGTSTNPGPSWCPNTPTKMGLYSKYKPEIYVDDTYSEPTLVIQGHDGSLTIAFSDIRDQVLLEFEKRIYNNIKVDDNPIPLSIDEVNPYFYPAQTTALLPGFFRTTPYTYAETNQILSESFLTWVGQNRVDYTQQNYIQSNPFTYNYSQSGNRINGEPFLQGNWRGIYRYFYDTETPNTTPWEMVGFSEEPLWWMERYGPAPYTSGNMVLWDDLEAGIVGDPAAPYVLPEYIRPGLSQIIPAGSEGELLSPLECVVGLNDPTSFQKSWVAGDGGPVQASWWVSSSYPFAMMRFLALTKPAQFFSVFADRDLYRYDTTFGQYLYNGRYRLNAGDVQIYGDGVSKASYINWIVDYNRQSGVNSTAALTADLANLDVRLCYRMASFSDPTYLSVYTERAGPGSTNNSLQIPASSYDLVFYKNQPFNQITYSSIVVQVEQLAAGGIGYTVYGYSNVQPYFEILVSSAVGLYQTITAGGISVQVPAQYTENVTQIPYGYTFTNPAAVCNFILSYGAWLESQGLVFDNIENGYTMSWTQMAKEFLYFSTQGWTVDTLINLNPCATTITASQPISIVDTIASVTPENMLLDQNRRVIDVRNMIVQRNGNFFSVTTTDNQTINFLTLRFTNYEDMLVLNNSSQFNDLIYDPTTGARQARLNFIASTTTEWDGQLNAQGFILNLNNVKEWQAYNKYTKGDIVLYKNTYWQALNIVQPQEKFNYNDWIKSNYQLIDQGLLPNLANKADQLANTYSVYKANLASDNDLFAFGLIGFRPRQYMSEMNLSGVTQVQVYQQFLGTKGTIQAAEIFKNANLGKESGAYDIYENWGVLAGTYGAQANKSFFEIQLNQSLLKYNPSTIQIINPGDTSEANQTIYLSELWRESYPISSPDILPTTYESSNLPSALPSAGYVNLNDVDVTVFSINDPSAIAADIDNIGIGTYIWIAKINSYNWGVYRVAETPGQLKTLSDNLDGTSQALFNNAHGLAVSDLIIIKYFNAGVNGVYRVLAVPTPTSILIGYSFTNTNVTTLTGTGLVFRLQNARVSQASDIASLPFVNNLVPGSIAWIDSNRDGHWETVQKQSPFVTGTTLNSDINAAGRYGVSIAQTSDNLSALIGAPGAGSGAGALVGYYKGTGANYEFSSLFTLNATDTAGFGNWVSIGNKTWAVAGASDSYSGMGYGVVLYRSPSSGAQTQTQLLLPPDENFNPIGFGTSCVISVDEYWMYIGAPGANTVYAYERVDIEGQTVAYTTNGISTLYVYDETIQIDYNYPDQLIVTIDNYIATLNQDYTINENYVAFNIPPGAGQNLVIKRRQEIQLDQQEYLGVQQDTTSGFGIGAVFTVNNVRGEYNVTLNASGVGYEIGDTLTINGTQIGGATPANNLIITVTYVLDSGELSGFTVAGVGLFNQSVFALNTWLATATNIFNFTVVVDDQIQRPNFDYTFDEVTTNLTFVTVPGYGAVIKVATGTYWDYVANITTTSEVGDQFGASIATTTDGRQVIIGAPGVTANGLAQAGAMYVFDRSVLRYLVDDPAQTTYTIPGTINLPVSVNVNNVFLLSTDQSPSGQYTVSGNNIIFSNITFNYGDVIEFGTNQFQQIQQCISITPSYEAEYGTAVDNCPLNCSIYIGAPFDSTYLAQSGAVDHQVNQSRVYGITTSTIANPTLTVGGTLRINNMQISVPNSPNNNIAGLVTAINTSNIPNVLASTTTDLTFIGDGTTKIYLVGTIYSAAESYTTVVYLDSVLQTYGVDYYYDNTTQQINFVFAPDSQTIITVVSGRIILSVQNMEAALQSSLITVLPGTNNSVFDELGFNTFVPTQQILSPAPTVYGQFGASLSIDSSAVNLIVGSPNGNVYEPTTFDLGQTYFDEHSTTFYNPINNGGVAYTYDFFPSSSPSVSNPGQFAFGQQIYNDIIVPGDRFGIGVNYVNGKLVVGATGGTPNNVTSLGYATEFNNPTNAPAWYPIRIQQPVVDVYQINSVFAYNGGQVIGVNEAANAGVQTYFDFFDPLQGKILGAARRNINYIGAVDPAQYNTGSIHDNGNFWGPEHLGEMWWDTDTVRFIDPNQDDMIYASRKWGSTFPGSRVDIYQWIESTNPPASYTGTGIPLSTISYTISSQLGQNNIFQTLYYYWVRGITTIATGSGKTLSATAVASYITDPRSSGLPYIAALNASTIAIYNAYNLLNATNTILYVGFDQQLNDAVVHQEYELIQDGIADSFLTANLYRKFQDSLCGIDTAGNSVPDPLLNPGMRYGVQFRPRQSMFADRFTALQNYLGRANKVLAQFPITETRSFNLLNASAPIPTQITATASQASISGNILTVAGTITGAFDIGMTITGNTIAAYTVIIGFGTGTGGTGTYILGNYQTVLGTGITGTIGYNFEVPNLEVLGYQNLNLVPIGYRYLVLSDSSQTGRWTIYEVDTDRTLSLAQVQSYDTPLYWYYINWYLPGYNSSIAPVVAVQNYGQLATLSYTAVPIGSSARVINNGAGKFEIYLRIGTDPIKDWQRVGLEDGTIAFKEELWNYSAGNFGFDAEVFDAQYFDEEPVVETRYIIQALNEEIYVDDLQYERNSSLILMFNYVYSEFTDPSWLIKTSLVDVNHNIRALQPYQTYLQDNQTFVIDYFQEVKPYHVQVRQFNLIYTGIDNTGTDVSDYDVPAYYDLDLEAPQFVSPILTPYDTAVTPSYSILSDAAPDAQIWLTSPWSEWYNNYLLSLDSVLVAAGGAGYTIPPIVTVTGACVTPAILTAIINGSGHVVSITVVSPGSGYTETPIITISGGNLPANPTQWSSGLLVTSNLNIISLSGNIYITDNTGQFGNIPPSGAEDQVNGNVGLTYVGTVAVAVAQMGNPLVRSIKTTIKYDRYQYQSNIEYWQANVVYTNGTRVRYFDQVWQANGTVTSSIFNPEDWIIVDAALLGGVDRTMGFYVSTPNTPGLSLPLLIDGIDYPGVQVTGVSFDQDTGYDRGNFDINPFDNYSLDPNGRPTYDLGILDTMFESSYLDPYLGTRPTDINVDGGAYVGPFESHAPEELVPGIEFDTLDLRVYTTPGADWLKNGHGYPQQLFRTTYNSTNPTISFAGYMPYPTVITVVNNSTQTVLTRNINYTVYWPTQTITIIPGTVANGSNLGIYVYEFGGGNQIYKNVYPNFMGQTLIVPVEYDQIQNFGIFINGYQTLPNTQYTYAAGSAYGTTVITFNILYTVPTFISLVAIAPTTIDEVTTNYTWSIPVTSQTITADGSLTYNVLVNTQYTNTVTAIVNVNGVRARTAAGIDYIADGITTVYEVAQRLGIDQSTIADSEVFVYQNEILTTAYTVQPNITGTTITFNYTPPVGTRIYIAVTTGAQAVIDSTTNTLIFNPAGGLIPIAGQPITITWFNDTRQQRLLTQVFVGPFQEGIIISEGFDETNYDPLFVDLISTVTQTVGSDGIEDTFTATDIVIFSNFDVYNPTTNLGLEVYVNGILQTLGTDYEITNNSPEELPIEIQFFTPPAVGSVEFILSTYSRNTSTDAFNNTSESYDFSTGGTTPVNDLNLGRIITDTSRLWVTLNGKLLSPGIDFTLDGTYLILSYGVLQTTDVVMINMVTDSVVSEALAFRIFQDMRGVQATYRITPSTTTTLVENVSINDDTIYLDNASALSIPNFAANLWGVVMINGERIMYREINFVTNTISSLLRGTAGTGADAHLVGAEVTDMGRANLLSPEYQDYIVSNRILANGTTTVYTAEDISLVDSGAVVWVLTNTYVMGDVVIADDFYYRAKINVPASTAITNTEYWQAISDTVEVYVGGTLQTSGYTITNENPVIVEFTTAPADGSEVVILVRRGVTWYQQGLGTASDGIPLQQTNTIPARFLRGL